MWSSFVRNWRRWSSVVNAAAGAPARARARALRVSAVAQRARARDPPLRRPRGMARAACGGKMLPSQPVVEMQARRRSLACRTALRAVCEYPVLCYAASRPGKSSGRAATRTRKHRTRRVPRRAKVGGHWCVPGLFSAAKKSCAKGLASPLRLTSRVVQSHRRCRSMGSRIVPV